MNIEYKVLIIVGLILIIAALVCFNFQVESDSNHQNSEVSQRTDTVFIEVLVQPLIIENMEAKITKKVGPEIKTQPFEAAADTVVDNDTIQISYSFPENNFNLKIFPGADSIMIQRVFTETHSYLPEKWWENPLYLAIGILIGLIIGVL
jgi:hypothetical protein